MATTTVPPGPGAPTTGRRAYPEDLKTQLGVGMMATQQVLATSLIGGTLLLFLTDYATLFPGRPGAAAAAATTLLVAGRVWDAFNDPLLGFVMDRSPRTRWGRYKPFALVAIPVSTLLIILLFNLPPTWPDHLKLACLYVLYFAFDACFTLMPFMPLLQSLSNEARVRAKHMAWYRVPSLVVAMLGSSFMAVAIAFGTPEQPAIGLAVVVFLTPVALLSMLGVAMIKEGAGSVEDESVRLRDVVTMVRTNKPLWVSQLSSVFFGFVWNMLFVAASYYAKYAFGVENFAAATAALGVSIILSNILGVFVVQPFLKRATPANVNLACLVAAAVPLTVLYVLNLAGPIRSMPLFLGLVFLTTLAIGAGFVPGSMLILECMDYNRYRIGKTLQGSLTSVVGFIQKLQAAGATAITGTILVAVGYDATAYADADTIPPELFGALGLAMFGIPVLCAVASAAVLWFYPMRRPADRDRVYAEIEAHQAQHEEAADDAPAADPALAAGPGDRQP